MKYIRTIVPFRRIVQQEDSPSEGTQLAEHRSLDIVSEEMRQRVADQDSQAAILATKASFLFTAGTTVLGASAALAALLMDDAEVGHKGILLPTLIVAGAYVWLAFSFFLAFRVRIFYRVPTPKKLMEYSTLAKVDSLRKVADGRRYALEKNEKLLTCAARWVNHELICLMILITSVLVTLATVVIV